MHVLSSTTSVLMTASRTLRVSPTAYHWLQWRRSGGRHGRHPSKPQSACYAITPRAPSPGAVVTARLATCGTPSHLSSHALGSRARARTTCEPSPRLAGACGSRGGAAGPRRPWGCMYSPRSPGCMRGFTEGHRAGVDGNARSGACGEPARRCPPARYGPGRRRSPPSPGFI